MKGYKFKLEALLKIRRLKEDQCKQQIGQLQVHKSELEGQIQKFNSEVSEMYHAQEETLESGASGQEAKFFPFFMEGKRAHINQTMNRIDEVNAHIQTKLDQLKHLRADVKVIEKMREKDLKNYKLRLNKKQSQDLEETTQNWKMATKG